MTLYIYRVGWTYPARNLITRSKSIKIPSCTRIPLGPVRPVDPTGETGRLLPDGLQRLTGQTARAYRSDRSVLSNANFGCQQQCTSKLCNKLFCLHTFNVPCMRHLLYLMFRCDFDMTENLVEQHRPNVPLRTVRTQTCQLTNL